MGSTQSGSEDALEVFFSYAREDEDLRDELATHLALLERDGKIRSWHDRRIEAGDEWARRIDERLESADLVHFLVTPDFLASDDCWDVEMKRALARHDDGAARVIPVVVRPVDWDGAPCARLQARPEAARPVTSWADRDEAWVDVARGIRVVIDGAIPRRREDAARCRRLLTELYDSVDDLQHLGEDLRWPVSWDAGTSLAEAAAWLAAQAVRRGAVAELLQRIAEDHPSAPGLAEPAARPRAEVVNRVLRLLSRPDLPGVALLEPYGFGGREVVGEVMARLADRPDDAGRRALPVRLVPERRTLDETRLYRALARNLRRELERQLGRPLPAAWEAALPAAAAPDRFDFEEALEDLLRGPVTDEGRSLVVAVEGLSRVGREDLLSWAAIISRLTVGLPLKVLAWGGEELSDLCSGYAHLEHGSPFERLETVELGPLDGAEVRALAPGSGGALLEGASGGHPALVDELLRRSGAPLR